MDAYSAFRIRDFRLLLAATFLSGFGLQMLSVAVSWDLYVQTRSAMVLGNVGLAQVAPFLMFALFAGRFADQHDRRRIMIGSQAIFLVASALLIFVTQNGGYRTVAMIYTCLFLTSTARSFQWPARLGVLPHIVPPEVLSNAITWNSSVQEIASVSGPAVAGLLLATVGSRVVYSIQVACALLTLALYYSLRYRSQPAVTEARDLKSLLEGVRFVWENKLILPAISLDLFGVLFGGATALLPIYAVDILHIGAAGLGWLRAAPSIGAVMMAVTTAHMPRVRSAGKMLLWAVAGFGGATVVFGVSHSVWLSFAMLIVIGACDNISVVLRHSLVQTETPDRLRGRVLAVHSIFISCSNQFGAVESGWTAAWFGAVLSVAGGGVATIAIVLICAAVSVPLRQWQQ